VEYHYQRVLLSELKIRKARNPSYSLRAFARFLGMSPGHLSQLIRGRKSLSRRQATNITARLDLCPEERRDFLLASFAGGEPQSSLW
jgi:DNA-binding transcriptional regulator YdaS (Cro superfamily)